MKKLYLLTPQWLAKPVCDKVKSYFLSNLQISLDFVKLTKERQDFMGYQCLSCSLIGTNLTKSKNVFLCFHISCDFLGDEKISGDGFSEARQ